MPIYEARCRRCNVKFSYLTKVEHRHDTGGCPGCGAPAEDTEQVMSATPTNFKFADVKAIKSR